MNLIQKSPLARFRRKTDLRITEKEIPIGLSKGVSVIRDVPYLKEGKRAHMLDIYCPITYEDEIPVIVYIHGGGFENGSKDLNRHFCMKLSNYGFLVFSLEYRLCPETNVYGQLQDIAAALHYVDKMGPKFRGIPGMIHMAGDSVGALFYIQKMPGYIQRRVLGMNYRQHPFYAYLDPSRPILGLSIPECILITSKKDKYYSQTRDLAEALCKWETPSILKDYGSDPSLSHAFCVSDPERPESRMVIHDIVTFFRENESK